MARDLDSVMVTAMIDGRCIGYTSFQDADAAPAPLCGGLPFFCVVVSGLLH
jgi:hypothetical protein